MGSTVTVISLFLLVGHLAISQSIPSLASPGNWGYVGCYTSGSGDLLLDNWEGGADQGRVGMQTYLTVDDCATLCTTEADQ